MGLVYACITPHGSSIIEELAGNERELFRPTREAMVKLGDKMKSYQPDTIIVLTPHGLRLRGYANIYISESCRGSLSDNGNTISADFKCDRELAETILKKAQEVHIPIIGANYGTISGEASNIEMDWGTLIPLWYMGARDEKRPQLVVIGPSREIPLEDLVKLGKIIAEAALASGKKIALVASADQAHAHDPNGIYGFHPAAKEYDSIVTDIVKNNEFSRLLDFDMNFVNDAKPDSLWQMVILYGTSLVVPMKSQFYAYDAPTYFGMLVAGMDIL